MILLARLILRVCRVLFKLVVFLFFPDSRNIKIVVVESPFAGNESRNLPYARMCLRDCFLRNEIPFASHLLYTQEGILRDDLVEERNLGIKSGLIFALFADKTVVYVDYGVSAGMKRGIEFAERIGRKVEYRKI